MDNKGKLTLTLVITLIMVLAIIAWYFGFGRDTSAQAADMIKGAFK